MKKAITSFFMGWGMFWIVPCPYKKWDETAYPGMLLSLDVIGCLIGLVWAAAAIFRNRFLPGFAGAALLVFVPKILSGFIHMDGYLDCADAVLSRRDLETRLKILKDSHIGSFAAIAMSLLFLVEFAFWCDGIPNSSALCLIFVSAVPRACTISGVLLFRPLSGSSYSRMFKDGVKRSYKIAGLILLLGLIVLPVLLFHRQGLCALAAAVGAWATVLYIRKDLGGMSGDVSGAGITVGELCGLAALVLLS